MRWFIFTLLLLGACDDFAAVQKADTIEAWEKWLAEHPGDTSPKAVTAKTRLEDLYAAAGTASATVEAYDAYLTRFPKGKQATAFTKAREDQLFREAEIAGTAEGWKRFRELCPGAGRRLELAKSGEEAANYAAKLAISEVRTQPVNLAEDPKGPMNGTGFFADVTNNGDKTLSLLWMNLVFLGKDGAVLDLRDGPVASPQSASRLPLEEALKKPLAPGETRTFAYTTGELPEGYDGRARLFPARVAYVAE